MAVSHLKPLSSPLRENNKSVRGRCIGIRVDGRETRTDVVGILSRGRLMNGESIDEPVPFGCGAAFLRFSSIRRPLADEWTPLRRLYELTAPVFGDIYVSRAKQSGFRWEVKATGRRLWSSLRRAGRTRSI